MRILLLALMLLGFAAVNGAEVSPFAAIAYEDQATGFKFPQMLSTYRFNQKLEYGSAPLGYGLSYIEVTGTNASIIVYDLGLPGIPDGTSDTKILDEFRKIDASISRLVQKGEYKSAQRVDKMPPLSKQWLQVNHEILLPDGRKLHSYSFIRGQNGKFVKIRISGTSEGIYARLPSFMLSVTRAIDPSGHD